MSDDVREAQLSLQDALYIQNSSFLALCAALEKAGYLDTSDVARHLSRLAENSAAQAARSLMLSALAGKLAKGLSVEEASSPRQEAGRSRPSLRLVQGGLK